MPQIRCTEGRGLMFVGSDNAEKMNATLSRLFVIESFVSFQDSFVNIDGCKFEGSKQALEIVLRTSMVLSIQITNSTFSRNSESISVVVNSTQTSSQYIRVMFKLINSTFDGNVLSNESRCISLTELPNNGHTVSCYIALDNVIFSSNKFSSNGLVLLEMNNGDQYINLQNVTFTDNRPSSGRDVLTGDGDSENIVRGTDVNVFINSSNFRSQNARSFNVTSSNISLQIYNSSFCGNTVKGNGGVISLKGNDLCMLTVYNSSFVNTTATQGGAIDIECVSVKANFDGNIFQDNTARNGGGGGAVYVFSPYFLDKADVDNSIQGEKYLQINVTKCNFTNAYSSLEGGAVCIYAVRASMRLRDSAFTNCTARDVKEKGGGGGGGVFIYTGLPSLKQKSDRDLFLIVENSRFIRCSSAGPFLVGGSLTVAYKTQVEININNSYFGSNYAAAFTILSHSQGRTKNTSHVTIEHSTFFNNSAISESQEYGGAIFIGTYNHSIVTLENVTMELNRASGFGGAIAISNNCTIKISKSRFLHNTAYDCGGAIYILDLNYLQIQDSIFDHNNAQWNSTGSEQLGGALCIGHRSSISTIIFIINTTFSNCLGGSGGGAIFLSLTPAVLKNPGCIEPTSQIDVRKKYPSWDYKSHMIFEDTTFERNIAGAGGAIQFTSGKATFRNCTFIDNLAKTHGGHIYTVTGSASLDVQDCVFRQNELEVAKINFTKANYTKASFIHAESSGALKLYNTTMDILPYGSIGPLLLVRNGRLIDLGNNNLTTTFNCPVGSQIEILNFTDQLTTEEDDQPCKIEVTILEFSCSACSGNSYSLQRGRALGSQVAPGFQCLPCPFGANCSQNILAKTNFWGFKERLNPPMLKFTMCPLGYCSSPHETDFPKYNGCQGNRSGELCGQCNESYTETLYSTNCRLSYECKDYWFWPVALLYVSLMALYFTFKPPIVPWIKRKILWFKNHEPPNEEENFDRGYLKILFYFYQVANLILIYNSSQHILKTEFIDPFIGLFSFQQKFSSSGFICPFPGLTVVTKQLFSASHVFGTCLMIGVFYVMHWGVQKCRGHGAPSVGPYIGGILQTMLLGYTTLSSVSFNLLRWAPIGSEKHLLFDGNVVCFKWWQYILIGFVCAFLVPFVFVLFWGCFKLYSKTLSSGNFLLACCFPLPSLLYWVFFSRFCTTRNAFNEGSPSRQSSRNSIERVLYDSFKRPGDGGKLPLSWESVMIGRRLVLIVLNAFVSDPLPRLLTMSFFCVLFLQHHSMTRPFRDGFANSVETISLLSIVLLATINVFFASFLSLAVPFNNHFSSWWNFCQVVEIAILIAVPGIFCLLVIAAVLSQVCRLIFVVGRCLRSRGLRCTLVQVCFSWCYSKRDGEMGPLLGKPGTETDNSS